MENRKKEILELLKNGTVTIDEALDMLNYVHDDAPSGNIPTKKRVTYDGAIEKIAKDTVADIDIDKVLKIMQDMKWEYGLSGHIVTREEIIDCAKGTVVAAVKEMINNSINNGDAYGVSECGGFYCVAKVNDDEWPIIDIILHFQPYSGMSDGNIEELIYLKDNEE